MYIIKRDFVSRTILYNYNWFFSVTQEHLEKMVRVCSSLIRGLGFKFENAAVLNFFRKIFIINCGPISLELLFSVVVRKGYSIHNKTN